MDLESKLQSAKWMVESDLENLEFAKSTGNAKFIQMVEKDLLRDTLYMEVLQDMVQNVDPIPNLNVKLQSSKGWIRKEIQRLIQKIQSGKF